MNLENRLYVIGYVVNYWIKYIHKETKDKVSFRQNLASTLNLNSLIQSGHNCI